jgi:hypothetical protein
VSNSDRDLYCLRTEVSASGTGLRRDSCDTSVWPIWVNLCRAAPPLNLGFWQYLDLAMVYFRANDDHGRDGRAHDC